jgi:hypothetical protein
LVRAAAQVDGGLHHDDLEGGRTSPIMRCRVALRRYAAVQERREEQTVWTFFQSEEEAAESTGSA